MRSNLETNKINVHTSETPEAVALNLLIWVLSDQNRAERLLDLTGLTPDLLRDRLDSSSVQVAILDYVIAHEPDLIAACDDLDISPKTILGARRALGPTDSYETSI
ncbi:MAG: DUF3572 domain-containing protein [Pontixanthobacter sp.]